MGRVGGRATVVAVPLSGRACWPGRGSVAGVGPVDWGRAGAGRDGSGVGRDGTGVGRGATVGTGTGRAGGPGAGGSATGPAARCPVATGRAVTGSAAVGSAGTGSAGTGSAGTGSACTREAGLTMAGVGRWAFAGGWAAGAVTDFSGSWSGASSVRRCRGCRRSAGVGMVSRRLSPLGGGTCAGDGTMPATIAAL